MIEHSVNVSEFDPNGEPSTTRAVTTDGGLRERLCTGEQRHRSFHSGKVAAAEEEAETHRRLQNQVGKQEGHQFSTVFYQLF